MIYEIRCTSQNHCDTVQRTLFANGYTWAIDGQKLRELENLVIYVNVRLKHLRSSPFSWLGFDKQPIPISLSELLQL